MPLKTCPQCSKQVGPRLAKCECGHDFYAARPRPQSIQIPIIRAGEDKTPAPVRQYSASAIYAPAGECPFKPKSAEPEDILSWADKVQAHYRDVGQRIGAEGLVHYARTLYDFESEEFALARRTILDNIA